MVSSSTLSLPLKLLDKLIKKKVDDAVIDHLVEYVVSMVKVYPDNAQVSRTAQSDRKSKPSSSSKTPVGEEPPLPNLHEFVENISIRSRCTMATMLVALIYLGRLQKVLQKTRPTVGKPCSHHRVIFSALMISHKIWNDSSMVGKHWAEVSNLFTSEETLAMEREILILLKYDLELTVEEIWNVAQTFMKEPFFPFNPQEVAEAGAIVDTSLRLKNEVIMYQTMLQQELNRTEYDSPIFRPLPTENTSRSVQHKPTPIHPFSSLHYSSLSSKEAEHQSDSMPASPVPFPFDALSCSPALQSSPLLASPLLQTVPHPNSGVIRFSRTHTMRSSAGSTTRTTTKLTLKNVSHVSLGTKGSNAHVYLHNPPQQHHGHPVITPTARMKKRKYLASAQRFHLPTSMHSRPTHSPHYSNSNNSSSSFSTSIPSSPSCHSAGSSIGVYAQSPSMVWYAHTQEQHVNPPLPYFTFAPIVVPTGA